MEKQCDVENVMSFMTDNEEFIGKFIGYKESRGGLGITRIDDDWYECEDYLIPFDLLIKALKESPKWLNAK